MKNTDNNSQKPSWMTVAALFVLIVIVALLPFMSRSKTHKPVDPVSVSVAEEVTSQPQEQVVNQPLVDDTHGVITNSPVPAEVSDASVVITGQTGTFGFESTQKSHSQTSSILSEVQLRELVDAQKGRVTGRK